MNAITIEQACDPSNWKWKHWDVRADGKVFLRYNKQYKNGEQWVSWDSAINLALKKRKCADLWRRNNHERFKNRLKLWRLKNKNKIKTYKKNKRNYNLLHAMAERTRSRIHAFIRKNGYSKPSKTQEMLGCDWSHLKAHLESRFTDGMSWENRGMWHIDHIIPLASAKSIEEVVKLCHYTNLQPLWAADNLSKGAKILK